jgi:hypothetical protein
MMKIRKHQKLFFVLAAFFLVASFFFVLFHHHENGQHSNNDCAVCRLIQQFICFFALSVIALIGDAVKLHKVFADSLQKLTSLSLPSKLRNRAPPRLS